MQHDTATVEALAVMSSAFGRDMDEAAISAYLFALDGLSSASICQAVGRAIKEERFCPAPAVLRGLARDCQVTRRYWIPPVDAECTEQQDADFRTKLDAARSDQARRIADKQGRVKDAGLIKEV